jgi:hypothetical protein
MTAALVCAGGVRGNPDAAVVTRLLAGFPGGLPSVPEVPASFPAGLPLALPLPKLAADELACVLSSGVINTSPSEPPESAVSFSSPSSAAAPAATAAAAAAGADVAIIGWGVAFTA